MTKVPIAYQLYSAREQAAKDLRWVLAKVKSIGFDGVELAGLYGHSAAEMVGMLKETGLRAISCHVPLNDLRDDPFAVIALYRQIGCKYIVVPYLEEADRPGRPGFAGVLRQLDFIGTLARKAGMQLLYHNHDFEFVKLSGMYALDFLYAALGEKTLKAELDICWVQYAGLDPAAYLKKYKGRCPLIHLKDYEGGEAKGGPYGLLGKESEDAASKEAGSQQQADKKQGSFRFKPFGHGLVKAREVVTAGMDAGVDWFVVEQDESPDMDPLEAAEISFTTLKRIGVA